MTSITFFFLLIPILGILLLAINFLFATHSPYQEKNSAFECGFHSFLGQNRMQFNISFYIFGLLFLLFDLEILLIYPYPVSSYFNSLYGLSIMLIFFLILTLGFAFELGKNALKIDSRQYDTKIVAFKSKNILESNIFGSIYVLFKRIWPTLLISLIVLIGITGLPKILINNFFYSVYFLAIIAGIGAVFIGTIRNIKNDEYYKIKYINLCLYFLKGFFICIILLTVVMPYIKVLMAKYLPVYINYILEYIENIFILLSSLFACISSLNSYHIMGDDLNDRDIKIRNKKCEIPSQSYMSGKRPGEDLPSDRGGKRTFTYIDVNGNVREVPSFRIRMPTDLPPARPRRIIVDTTTGNTVRTNTFVVGTNRISPDPETNRPFASSNDATQASTSNTTQASTSNTAQASTSNTAQTSRSTSNTAQTSTSNTVIGSSSSVVPVSTSNVTQASTSNTLFPSATNRPFASPSDMLFPSANNTRTGVNPNILRLSENMRYVSQLQADRISAFYNSLRNVNTLNQNSITSFYNSPHRDTILEDLRSRANRNLEIILGDFLEAPAIVSIFIPHMETLDPNVNTAYPMMNNIYNNILSTNPILDMESVVDIDDRVTRLEGGLVRLSVLGSAPDIVMAMSEYNLIFEGIMHIEYLNFLIRCFDFIRDAITMLDEYLEDPNGSLNVSRLNSILALIYMLVDIDEPIMLDPDNLNEAQLRFILDLLRLYRNEIIQAGRAVIRELHDGDSIFVLFEANRGDNYRLARILEECYGIQSTILLFDDLGHVDIFEGLRD